MIIGVAKEIKTDEDRVALTPAGARELEGAGHRVLIERGAGVGSSIADASYVANGATIVDSANDVWAESELLLKVKEPVAEEYQRLGAHKNQVLFTYLHLAAARECTDALVAADNVAIAYETVRLRDNSLPLLTPMSEVAGRMATLMGAHHLMRPGGGPARRRRQRRERQSHLRTRRGGTGRSLHAASLTALSRGSGDIHSHNKYPARGASRP